MQENNIAKVINNINNINTTKKTNSIQTSKCSAYSLIELSIALILIALIVTGIIGGARIIKNARISSTISEMSDYSTDMNAFYDRFEQYPGDFNMASAMLVGSGIQDGDHNDLIGDINFSDSESAGFFHHLRLAGIITNIPFNGIPKDYADLVEIDVNYPGTRFSNDTFYYVSSDSIDGKYKENNRLVIASTAGGVVGSMDPTDAESFDKKIDNGHPLTGRVIAHEVETATETSGCVVSGVGKFTYIETIPLAQYNTNSSGKECILKKSMNGSEEIISASSCGSNCPTVDDDGNVNEQCSLATLPATVNSKAIIDWTGDVTHGSVAVGTCDPTYYASGTATATCNNGTWGNYAETCGSYASCPSSGDGYPVAGDYYVSSWDVTGYEHGDTLTGNCDTGYIPDPTTGTKIFTCNGTDGTWEDTSGACVAGCVVPAIDETGYENIISWLNITADPDEEITTPGTDGVVQGVTIQGTCDTGYVGSPETTCTTAPTWTDGFTPPACATCISAPCTGYPTYYCGDNWNCSSGTCCNNNITYGVDTNLDTIHGDCLNNCHNATLGDDTITGATYYSLGDCGGLCSGTFGNDDITNSPNATGDCTSNCSGTFGDDILSGTTNYAFGDCSAGCSGTMGNDLIINFDGYAAGDCQTSCFEITQWATDTFRYTTGGHYDATIYDFNASGVDDKIELPAGTTVVVTGTGYGRTLTYSGTISGTLNIQCNLSKHDCDNGGTWDVNACQIYIGGVQQSSCTGCGTGSCNFN